MTEQTAIRVLSETLEKFGVPKFAINVDSNIRLPDGQILRPDLVVVADDGEFPLAAFEVKVRGTLKENYLRAKSELGYLLTKGIKVFSVAPDSDGKLLFSQIRKFWRPRHQWSPLADLGKVLNYMLDSLKALDRLSLDEIRLARFRHWVVFVGISVTADVALIEQMGFVFSCKVYSLIGLIFALYAISYRLPVRLKFFGCEVSLVPKNGK